MHLRQFLLERDLGAAIQLIQELNLGGRQIGGIAGQVRQHLLGGLGLIASLEDMAAALHMSARSLRRKLDAEGTSYRAVLEDARRQMADQLLSSTTMKIEEMAVHLGYADTASFTRAFRRWHGTSPGQYRDRFR